MTKAKELIEKYDLMLRRKGDQVGFGYPNYLNKNKKALEEIKANKEDIKAELLRREQEAIQKEQEKEQEKEKKKEAIKKGEQKIKLVWHEGEILRGYMAFDAELEVLEELGLIKNIEGWGPKVEKIGEQIGEEFTYQQAVDFAKPIQEEKERKQKEREEKRNAKFEEAKRTGEAVVLTEITCDCNDPEEDCSLDLIREYAMPDGTIKEKRIHTY